MTKGGRFSLAVGKREEVIGQRKRAKKREVKGTDVYGNGSKMRKKETINDQHHRSLVSVWNRLPFPN